MRRISLPLIILGCIALAGLLTWIAVSGSFGRRPPSATGAPESSVTQQLPPFRRIDVSGSAEITLAQGDAESVTLPAEPVARGLMTAEVRDGTLYIESRDHSHWWDMVFGNRDAGVPLVIAFKNVDAIVAAGTVKIGATKMRAENLRIAGAGGTAVRIEDLETRDLKIVGAGALRADLAGRAAEADITISGAGEFRGARLATQNATVTVAGAGKVTIKAEKTLKATISGAGSVEYLGDPEVTQRVSGAGRVRRRDAATGGVQVALQ